MSSGGGMLHEEEKAAETMNIKVYIKKMEKEKLEKLAAKGFSAEEAKKAVEGHPEAYPKAVKIIIETPSTTASTDSDIFLSAIAGFIPGFAFGVWFSGFYFLLNIAPSVVWASKRCDIWATALRKLSKTETARIVINACKRTYAHAKAHKKYSNTSKAQSRRLGNRFCCNQVTCQN